MKCIICEKYVCCIETVIDLCITCVLTTFNKDDDDDLNLFTNDSRVDIEIYLFEICPSLLLLLRSPSSSLYYKIVTDSCCSEVASSMDLKSCKQLVDLSTAHRVVGVTYSLKHSVNACVNC